MTGRVLIANCENLLEPHGAPCPGRLRYRWGQSDAPCNICGGRCGLAVAAWLTVEAPATEEREQRRQDRQEEHDMDGGLWQ